MSRGRRVGKKTGNFQRAAMLTASKSWLWQQETAEGERERRSSLAKEKVRERMQRLAKKKVVGR
jgi:hypothetical protein